MGNQVAEIRRNQEVDRLGGPRLGTVPWREPGPASLPVSAPRATVQAPLATARLDQTAGCLGELLTHYGGDHRRALAVSSLVAHRLGLAECLELLAAVARGEGDVERVSVLLGAAAAQRASLMGLLTGGAPRGPGRGAVAEQATRPLGTEAAAWALGYAMALEEAVGYALAGLSCPARRAREWPEAMPGPAVALTPREREVAGLIARGRSNREIADRLVLSVRTVERHVENIYAELGLCGKAARAAVASYALRTSGEDKTWRS
jgi:non-specific serine/threonine protein kinase